MTVLAVDVGGSSSKLAVVEPDGRVVRFDRVSHPDGGTVDLQDLARRLSDWADAKPVAVGFSVPGIVENGRMRSARDKAAPLLDLDLAAWSGEELGLPVLVENDARAACWGEFRFGAGRGARDLITLSLGTGVGVGAVVAGRLLRGAHGQGAALGGHVPSAEGPVCNCGAFGCVEAQASGWVSHRDGIAGQVPPEFVAAWALAIVGWCHVLDPARIVLTGGISSAAAQFLPDLQHQVLERLWDRERAPEFVVAEDVWTSAARGVADLAWEGSQ